ncbi:hypothetical protein FVEG_08218 [Fusarium verticillioides 7600]|uniref:Uncharacterized protein n=1 Tax=Gibberella moniliformis (strain M3125 / FGSC 7600) TaxID=334819 RepID=W7ML15_GIBM7|nr:hypothetical protein FVEG_08218 [Fusarium verticillioides 7600]EWG48444.1 hypothetical protein FVEG_08218 [Fusarium verticillioides 7600]
MTRHPSYKVAYLILNLMPPNRTDKKSGDNSPNSAGSANQPRDMRRKLTPHGWSGASSQLKEAGPLSQGRFCIVGSACSSQRQVHCSDWLAFRITVPLGLWHSESELV